MIGNIKGLVLLAPMVDNFKNTYDSWLEKSSIETQKQQLDGTHVAE